MKKAVLKNFAIFTGKLQACNFIKNTLTLVFSSEYCKIFKNTYLEKHLLTAASDFFDTATKQQWAATSVLTLLLSSDNLLTGYEQLSY